MKARNLTLTSIGLPVRTELPVSNVNSFINACCLCDLFEVHQGKHSPKAAAIESPAR